MLPQGFSQLGVMSIPLLGLSTVALALIFERVMTYATQPGMGRKRVRTLLSELQSTGCAGCRNPERAVRLCDDKHCLHQGVGLLLRQADSPKAVREEVAGMWLLKHRQRMHAGLRFLMLIGLLSPMVGLLGTVLGMITMFQGMADNPGPITPAVLAHGLFTAMYSTAYGLVIAIPALAASHGFTLWANRYLFRLEFVLNHVNLMLEGIDAGKAGVETIQGDNVTALRRWSAA